MGELVVIGGIAVVLIGAAAREVIGFVRWRIRLNRLERGEWDRVVRLLRD